MNKFNNKDKEPIINWRISADTLRVIDKDRVPLGVMTKDEALSLAKEEGLDLVLVVENASPPVAKIVELNKYLYEAKKEEKDQAKKARASRIEVKEIKFKPNIGENDLIIKLKRVQEFIDSGAKVKITIQMRGRENSNSKEVFSHFKESIDTILENFKYDSPLMLNGNRIIGVLYKDG